MNRDVARELVSIMEASFLKLQAGAVQLWLWVSQAFLVPGEYVLGLLVARAPALLDFTLPASRYRTWIEPDSALAKRGFVALHV